MGRNSYDDDDDEGQKFKRKKPDKEISVKDTLSPKEERVLKINRDREKEKRNRWDDGY